MKKMQENIEAAFEHIGDMAKEQAEDGESESSSSSHIEKFKKVIAEFMGDVVQAFGIYEYN